MEQELREALRLQQAGRFADAAQLYHAALVANPNHGDALHLFGVLHFQTGYYIRAVDLIEQAIRARPGVPDHHANLAEAYRAARQFGPAIDSCRTALRLRPNYPEAANNLGLALHDGGRFDAAVEAFGDALRMRPTFAVAQNNLGTSLLSLGRLGDALQAYRAAVDLDGELASARSNLGQLLVDQGELSEGLTQCQAAVRLEPANPSSLNNLGNAHRATEQWADAHAAYDRAEEAAGPARRDLLPQIHANRGLALFLEGRREEAFVKFRLAVELTPDDVSMWRYLAKAYDADENHAAALEAWREIVRRTPNEPSAHTSLGFSLQSEGHLDEAADCFRRALDLRPGDIEALLNLGGWHEEAGDLAAAEACFRKARSLYPNASPPLSRLAQLLRGKLPDADRETIRAHLGDDGRQAGHPPNLTPNDSAAKRAAALPPRSPVRVPLLYGLAQVLDAQGQCHDAARHLEQANAMAKEQRRSEGRIYDSAYQSDLVDRIIAGFTPQFFERLSDAGDPTDVPVFIFGMPRSGTTLIEQVLASHTRVHGAGELRLAQEAFESIPSVLGMPDDMSACLDALEGSALQKIARRHYGELRKIAGVFPDSPREVSGSSTGVAKVVDKMPGNYLYLGLLAVLFPRATFIHARRSHRDVALSCWMTNFKSIRWADDVENLAQRFHDYRRIMRHWTLVLPRRVVEVDYEKLVCDFDHEARRLVSACGLEWEAGCGQFHQTVRPVRTASVTQVRQPLYRSAVARWKRYAEPLAGLFARLPNDDA